MGCLMMGLATSALWLGVRGRFNWSLDWVEQDLAEKLRRMRAPTKNLHRYLVAWLFAAGLIFASFWTFLGNRVFALLFSIFLLCLPWYLVRRMAERRRQKIEDQLADSMVTMASAVTAGLSLAQALEILAAQCPKPISTEFHQMSGEYKMGKPLEQVLLEAKDRLRSENFALFAASLLAAHESGGRLNETVERIAQSVLEMQRLERKVQSETAQARKSAIYMAMAPVFILVAYYFIDPVNTTLLFTDLVGQILLGLAIVFNVVAYFWARAILTPDI
jgi:Flp pilus assembly protein TadB